jgi:hypothetical protein
MPRRSGGHGWTWAARKSYDKAAKELNKFEYPREEEGGWLAEATALLKTQGDEP